VVANELSRIIGLKTVHYMLNSTINILAIALVVLFQPELRRGLEQIGRSRFKDFFNFDEANTKVRITSAIEEIIKACSIFLPPF
jgi:diadenylate cyclase